MLLKLFRSLGSGFCFAVFGIGGIITGTIVFPLVILFYSRDKQRVIMSAFVRKLWTVFVALMSGLRLIRITGKDLSKLSHLNGHIIVANHPSLIDIVILGSMIPNTISLVKGSLAHNIWIKHIIRRLYLVNDTAPDVFLEQAGSLLKQGFNLVIFPEGTRTTAAKPHFYRGFAYLALSYQIPILPIHIDNTPRILGKHQSWYQMGTQTSVFTFTLLPTVKPPARVPTDLRPAAKALTDKIRAHLFE